MLLIRADASASMGFGHVSRCLAIAEAVTETGGEVAFATRAARSVSWHSGHRVDLIGGDPDAPLDAHEPERLAELARAVGASCVLVDHYGADDDYLAKLRQAGAARIALLDDGMGRRGQSADLVVNFQLGARCEGYAARRLLLGTQYVPLRRAIRARRRDSRARERATLERVLVVLGGSDALGLGSRIAAELDQLLPREASIRVVVGPAAVQVPDVRALSPRVAVLGPLSAEALAEEMVQADAAVATPSTVFWELATLGVPSVLVRVAANQLSADAISERGAAIVLGPADAVSAASAFFAQPAVRERASRAASDLLDGEGAARLARELLED